MKSQFVQREQTRVWAERLFDIPAAPELISRADTMQANGRGGVQIEPRGDRGGRPPA